MSRIGKQPIAVPEGVTVSISEGEVRVNGPKGELSERIPRDITVAHEDTQLVVTRPTDRPNHRALHGLTRSLVANMVEGVTNGYAKTLEIQGGMGTAIVSTSRGVMTGHDARRAGVGGERVARVW